MKDLQIKQAIIDACLWMQDKGFTIGTWGNVAVRSGDTIIMTPSKVAYEDLTPEDMVTIDYEGNVLEGRHNPTSEKEIHRQVLVSRPDLGACVHSHSAFAIAACCTGYGEVPAMFEEMSQLLGGAIPITPEYVAAERHADLGKICADNIGEKNAVLIKHHGPVCCGRTLQEALTCVQVVEKACQVFLAIAPRSEVQTIPQEFVESERYRYLYKYGKEKT